MEKSESRVGYDSKEEEIVKDSNFHFDGLAICVKGKSSWIDVIEEHTVNSELGQSENTANRVDILLVDEQPQWLNSFDEDHVEIFRNGDLMQGRVRDKYFTKHKDGYGYYCTPSDRGTKFVVWGNRADLGAVSIIKTEVLKHYQRKYDNFIVMHGGSVVDKRDSSSIVITGVDYKHPRGNATGKTTALMSLALHQGTTYKYLSNDEVVLIADNGDLDLRTLPSPIPVREGTFQQIERNGVTLKADQWVDIDKTTGEKTQYISPASIKSVGFETESRSNSVKYWIFCNLSPSEESISVSSPEREEARRLFMKSIYFKRMNQSCDKKFLGDYYSNHSDLLDSEKTADVFFELLEKNGVRFVVLSGGLNMNNIYNTIESLS